MTCFVIAEEYIFVSDSPQQMKLSYVTMSGLLSLQPALDEDQSSNALANGDSYHMERGDNYVMITGCALEEKKLKDWLRTCAKQVRVQLLYEKNVKIAS